MLTLFKTISPDYLQIDISQWLAVLCITPPAEMRVETECCLRQMLQLRITYEYLRLHT